MKAVIAEVGSPPPLGVGVFTNELNVYWSNDVNRVFNIIGAYSKDGDICIRGIDGKSLATNIAYFQKQLDEKINQDSQHDNN